MFLNFSVEYIQKFTILRDYYVGTGDVSLHGIYFILRNDESGEIKDFFLEKKYINNEFLWEKTKKNEVEYLSYGLDKGSINSLTIETGFVEMKKKFGKDQTSNHSAKRYKITFKENHN